MHFLTHSDIDIARRTDIDNCDIANILDNHYQNMMNTVIHVHETVGYFVNKVFSG